MDAVLGGEGVRWVQAVVGSGRRERERERGERERERGREREVERERDEGDIYFCFFFSFLYFAVDCIQHHKHTLRRNRWWRARDQGRDGEKRFEVEGVEEEARPTITSSLNFDRERRREFSLLSASRPCLPRANAPFSTQLVACVHAAATKRSNSGRGDLGSSAALALLIRPLSSAAAAAAEAAAEVSPSSPLLPPLQAPPPPRASTT